MMLPETEPWGPDADHAEALRMNAAYDGTRCSNTYCQHEPSTHRLPENACDQRRCGCSRYNTDPPKPGLHRPRPVPAEQFVIPTELTHIDRNGHRRLGARK